MSQSAKNGATVQEVPDKSQISRKRWRILLLGIEKEESRKLNIFRNYSSRLVTVHHQHNQSGQIQSSKGNVYEKTDQELGIPENTGTIPK